MDMDKNDFSLINFNHDYLYRQGIRIDQDEIIVGSGMTTYYKSFPLLIKDNLKTYQFVSIMAMPDFLVGEYFSVATYKEINEG